MTSRWVIFAAAIAFGATADALAQAYCAPPKAMPQSPPPPPPPSVCQPQVCGKCTTSPCYVDSGIYVNDAVDLSIPTNGFPLLVSRHYDSSVTVDGPLGIGWTSSLTPHLYYATYMYATNVYQYEADVVMPDGVQYRFSDNGGGTFTPPAGRHDTLVRNANGTFILTLQRSRSTYSFAADGSMTAMTDDFGNALTFTYDGNGRVQTVADTSGSSRSLTVTWNPQGRIADVSDSGSPARHIVYSYNTDGTLSGVRDPVTPSGQQSTTYTYTTGRYAPVLARIDDRWGRVITRLAWQSDGKLSSYTEGDYSDANPPASTGEKYVYSYSWGNTTKSSSLGAVGHAYTTNGLITDHATYDQTTGNVLSATDGAGTTTTYTYDARGNVATIGRGGIAWVYTYDSNYPDQAATITPRDASNQIPTNYASWAFDYKLAGENAPGALKRVKRYSTTRAYTQTTAEYVYDAKGHVLSVTDEYGRISTFTYDAAGDRTSATSAGVITTYAYDGLGRVTSATDALGHASSYTYDGLDRVLSVRLPRPSSASTLDFVTAYSYDNLDSGIVYTNVTDSNGHLTKTGYDALGHVVRAVDARGNVTQFTYQYNLLKSITDANGNVTSYVYDINRNLSSATFPDGAVEFVNLGYDGTMLYSTDRRGITTSYHRDALGRINSVSITGMNATSYTYDGERLASVSFQAGQTYTAMSFSYDDNWRLASETLSGEYTITYLPENGGYTITPAAGVPGAALTVNYFYDAYKRLHQITSDAFGTFTIDYNALGQYSRISYPSGQTRDFTYDDQGRLTLLANNVQGYPIASFQYDYDYNWATNAYSMLGQRTSLTVTPAAGPYQPSLTKYTYDADYQLTSAIQAPNVYTWTYDGIGNRTSSVNIPYTYYTNGANTLNGQRLRNDGGPADFTYDANGNMTGRVGQLLYTWDNANRLTSDRGTTYAYDYLGRRITATTNGTTTKYIPLGLNTIRERTGTTIRDYVFAPGIDEPLAKLESGTLTNYSVDGLGSIVATSDNNGTVLTRIAYDPWGGTSYLTPLFGFTGRETAPGGLWFLRARYYDPSIGRFLSEDPERYRVDTNLYRYVFNRPASLSDPLGRDPSLCCPQNQQRLNSAFTTVCQAAKGGSCQAMLRKYGVEKCFADKCNQMIKVVCIPKGQDCGGCGGPCNNMADPTRQIFLQSLAGTGLCGPLANTIAHELAHMCGIGPDVYDPVNRKKANDIGIACGGS